LTFRDTPVGGADSGPAVEITNTGSLPVTVSSYDFSPPGQSDFGVITTSGCKSTLLPGDICFVAIQFLPKAVGARAASFVITSDAAGSPQAVSLSGNGLAAVRTLTLSATSLSFPPTPVGGLDSGQTMEITSTGNAPVTVSGLDFAPSGQSDFRVITSSSCKS